jgi:hypothetical protein
MQICHLNALELAWGGSQQVDENDSVNKTRLRNMPLNRNSALLIRALQFSGASMTVERRLWCEATFPAKSLCSAAENSGRPLVAKCQERALR